MAFRPIVLFRMVKCRKCPRHCRPCLTPQEADQVQEWQKKAADNGEAWKAPTVCDACHQKSNDSQNKRTFKQVGRDFNDYGLTETELLEREIARLEAELAEVLSKGDE